MRFIFTILLFILFSTNVFAQSKGFLSINLGKGIPTGEYGSMNYSSDKAGIAMPGWNFDLSWGVKAGKYTGLMFTYHNQVNRQKEDILVAQAKEMFPGNKLAAHTGDWRIVGFFMGPYGTLNLSEYTSFQPRIQLGYINAYSPNMTIEMTNKPDDNVIANRAKSTAGFAALIGGSLRFDGEKGATLYLNIDYLYANPEFVRVKTYTVAGDETYSTFRQKITCVNLGVGLGLWFGAKSNKDEEFIKQP